MNRQKQANLEAEVGLVVEHQDGLVDSQRDQEEGLQQMVRLEIQEQEGGLPKDIPVQADQAQDSGKQVGAFLIITNALRKMMLIPMLKLLFSK